jgi:hypothetical protein
MGKRDRMPVTMRALLQRINRVLAKDEERLSKNRGGPYTESLPAWIRVNMNRNHIIGGTDDLEEYGRELKCLQPWERVVDEGDTR